MPQWFKAEVSFEAISQADADLVFENALLAICRGVGEGEDHECKMMFVAGGPTLVDEDEED